VRLARVVKEVKSSSHRCFASAAPSARRPPTRRPEPRRERTRDRRAHLPDPRLLDPAPGRSSESPKVLLEHLDDYPLLSPTEERQLAQRIEAGDAAAKDRMAACNLRLVASIAGRYRNRGVPFDDLFQEGCIGLNRAIELYDWRKSKFSTYATLWIEQGIVRALDEGRNTIRVPPHVGYNQRRAIATQHRLRKELGREPTRAEIAEGAGISVNEVKNALDAAYASVSLNALRFESHELGDFIPDDSVHDPEEVIAQLTEAEAVYAALSELDDDERLVIEARFGFGEWDGNGLTDLDDVGRFVSMTPKHVDRCLRTALPKLEAALASAV
jgi:RNA polymerase primary sigma factor